MIAANWAVFKTTDDILKNRWSRLSILIALIGMGCNLIATFLIGTSLGKQVNYAEADLSRWQDEYTNNVGKSTAWLYSDGSVRLSKIARFVRLLVPILGGAAFVLALFRTQGW